MGGNGQTTTPHYQLHHSKEIYLQGELTSEDDGDHRHQSASTTPNKHYGIQQQ